LIQEQPAHGYALYEQIRSTPELSLIWQVKRSKLYYLLEKLETEGFLSVTISSQGPYPDRKIYQLTSAGNKALDDWLNSPVMSSRYVRLAFLSKLYFLLRINKKGALDLIIEQKEICEGWLQNLEGQYQSVEGKNFISSQVFLFRIGQIQSMIHWLNNCREEISDKSIVDDN
ncbi:MAG: PadR family transcriptional regulator, partial [Anaerolineales bacterium]|nr:PadR family transcriptional regulator [Anaerolineales bacterium]